MRVSNKTENRNVLGFFAHRQNVFVLFASRCKMSIEALKSFSLALTRGTINKLDSKIFFNQGLKTVNGKKKKVQKPSCIIDP